MSTILDLHRQHLARLARLGIGPRAKQPAKFPSAVATPLEVPAPPPPEVPASAPPVHPAPRNWLPVASEKSLIPAIKFHVAREFGLSATELMASRRSRNIVRPRQIAMYLATRLTIYSLPRIGLCFGGMDHTTVLHAVRRVTAMMATDEKLRIQIESLLELFNAGKECDPS